LRSIIDQTELPLMVSKAIYENYRYFPEFV